MAATRDGLEAVIRRALGDLVVAVQFQPARGVTPALNKATETILKAADAYGLAEFGLAAERRRAALADVVGDGSYGGRV
jgi:hypothetical protein